MKTKKSLFLGLTISFCTTLLMVASANGTTINDDYIGGLYVDTLGTMQYTNDIVDPTDPNTTPNFDIDRMTVVEDGSDLVIDIYSRYFDNVGSGGTLLGDLFLSTDGWNPAPNNFGDTTWDTSINGNGEDWEVAATINYDTTSPGAAPIEEQTSGSLSLYTVTDGNIVYSDDITGLTVFRNGQEVLYDGTGGTEDGTWKIFGLGTASDEDDFLRFTFNYASLGAITDALGIRWTQTCANDIIEGSYPVPEPATILLFGVGLAGIIGVSRKK